MGRAQQVLILFVFAVAVECVYSDKSRDVQDEIATSGHYDPHSDPTPSESNQNNQNIRQQASVSRQDLEHLRNIITGLKGIAPKSGHRRRHRSRNNRKTDLLKKNRLRADTPVIADGLTLPITTPVASDLVAVPVIGATITGADNKPQINTDSVTSTNNNVITGKENPIIKKANVVDNGNVIEPVIHLPYDLGIIEPDLNNVREKTPGITEIKNDGAAKNIGTEGKSAEITKSEGAAKPKLTAEVFSTPQHFRPEAVASQLKPHSMGVGIVNPKPQYGEVAVNQPSLNMGVTENKLHSQMGVVVNQPNPLLGSVHKSNPNVEVVESQPNSHPGQLTTDQPSEVIIDPIAQVTVKNPNKLAVTPINNGEHFIINLNGQPNLIKNPGIKGSDENNIDLSSLSDEELADIIRNAIPLSGNGGLPRKDLGHRPNRINNGHLSLMPVNQVLSGGNFARYPVSEIEQMPIRPPTFSGPSVVNWPIYPPPSMYPSNPPPQQSIIMVPYPEPLPVQPQPAYPQYPEWPAKQIPWYPVYPNQRPVQQPPQQQVQAPYQPRPYQPHLIVDPRPTGQPIVETVQPYQPGPPPMNPQSTIQQLQLPKQPQFPVQAQPPVKTQPQPHIQPIVEPSKQSSLSLLPPQSNLSKHSQPPLRHVLPSVRPQVPVHLQPTVLPLPTKQPEPPVQPLQPHFEHLQPPVIALPPILSQRPLEQTKLPQHPVQTPKSPIQGHQPSVVSQQPELPVKSHNEKEHHQTGPKPISPGADIISPNQPWSIPMYPGADMVPGHNIAAMNQPWEKPTFSGADFVPPYQQRPEETGVPKFDKTLVNIISKLLNLKPPNNQPSWSMQDILKIIKELKHGQTESATPSSVGLNLVVQPEAKDEDETNLLLLLNLLATNTQSQSNYPNMGIFYPVENSGNQIPYFLGNFPCDRPSLSPTSVFPQIEEILQILKDRRHFNPEAVKNLKLPPGGLQALFNWMNKSAGSF